MTALFMLNISTMAHSKEIDLALYYKPGGGSDRHSSIIAKSLETQGVTVNKKFLKTITMLICLALQQILDPKQVENVLG